MYWNYIIFGSKKVKFQTQIHIIYGFRQKNVMRIYMIILLEKIDGLRPDKQPWKT